MKGKIFELGDRVSHPVIGKGTVTGRTYYTRYFTTWTCVTYDDWLGQKDSLCGETEELTLISRATKE